MKVIRELPRDVLDFAHARYGWKRRDSIITRICALFRENPQAVFEIDCEIEKKFHPRTCSVKVEISRINATEVFPYPIRAYHTKRGTLIMWMEEE